MEQPTRLFLHKWAAVRGITVAELLAITTSKEISEEIAFRGIVPFPEEQAQLQMACLCTMFSNANRGSDGTKATLDDFLPHSRYEQEKKQSIQEQIAIAKKATMLQQFYGG